MTPSRLHQAESYIRILSQDITSRRVGSPGNQAATKFFSDMMHGFGFTLERTPFDCIDWRSDGVSLSAGGDKYEAYASPYSLGCDVQAQLSVCSTLEQLRRVDVSGSLLLMQGDLTREQLMPKNFPFYNPDSHKELIDLLEHKQPLVIITATSRDPNMVGSMYPFPVFEDGDFNIPSVYITDRDGEHLAAHAEEQVMLRSQAQRIPSKGWNVAACNGMGRAKRIVIFAHIDSRIGTPGANDNATGVAVLLLLGELLGDSLKNIGIELVAMNGEDYYAAHGEKLFIAQNEGRFDGIMLGINLDDVGYYKGRAAYSLYNCTDILSDPVHEVFADYPSIFEGDAWYQGDHGLFLLNKVPALAITSELLEELMAEITHTPEDTADKVDPHKLVDIAQALHVILLRLDRLEEERSKDLK